MGPRRWIGPRRHHVAAWTIPAAILILALATCLGRQAFVFVAPAAFGRQPSRACALPALSKPGCARVPRCRGCQWFPVLVQQRHVVRSAYPLDSATTLVVALGTATTLAVSAIGLLLVALAVLLWFQDEGPRLDPGRAAVVSEWNSEESGTVILELPLEYGGTLKVFSHAASQVEGLPPGASPASAQAWRVLRFFPETGTTNLVQSVNKVIVPPGADTHASHLLMRDDCLPLAYTKTFASIVLSTLDMLGTDLFRAERPVRFLCIGLGGGSVPRFFSRAVSRCDIEIVELEPAVARAATEALGFVKIPEARVIVEDGVAYALKQVNGDASHGESGLFDAVLVDAYDAAGNVPEALRSVDGGLAEALAKGLLREPGLVATNILPDVDPEPLLEAYRTALQQRGRSMGFTAQAPAKGNRIVVQTCGAPANVDEEELRESISAAARTITRKSKCPFDMEYFAAGDIQLKSGPVKDGGFA